MEAIISNALTAAGLKFTTEQNPANERLDFYLPGPNVHIEVKQFHTPRIAEQMSRVANVIVIQGVEAARFFAATLNPHISPGENEMAGAWEKETGLVDPKSWYEGYAEGEAKSAARIAAMEAALCEASTFVARYTSGRGTEDLRATIHAALKQD